VVKIKDGRMYGLKLRKLLQDGWSVVAMTSHGRSEPREYTLLLQNGSSLKLAELLSVDGKREGVAVLVIKDFQGETIARAKKATRPNVGKRGVKLDSAA
jgi:hypothetical protein